MGSMTQLKTMSSLPTKMKALQYSKPETFAVVEINVPTISDEDVLIKVSACGVCGTDLHFHKGEWLVEFPFIPGHETVGIVVARGNDVTNVAVGERVAIDPLQPCRDCFYCVRGQNLMCERMTAFGGNHFGGIAEYCKYPGRHVHPIGNLPDLDAVLVEPAACATHGIERMGIKVGSTALLFGCGPTGVLLAQLMRLNGVAHLTIASKAGPKLDLAKQLNIADSYICISDDEAQVELEALKAANLHGFDLVVEATGVTAVLNESIYFVRKGGTLVVYGVYKNTTAVAWPPSRIWTYEITVIASFCSTYKFPTILEYLRAKKLHTTGIVNKTFRIEEWAECLEAVRKQTVVKAAIVFD